MLKLWPKEIPNLLSVVRGFMGLCIPFLILHPSPSFQLAAFILFLVASFTDFLDGYLARALSVESGIGKIIDPTADKVLVLLPLAAFASLGYYSDGWVVPIIIREVAVTFCRIGLSLEGAMIGAERVGKWKFVSQVGVIIAAFFYQLSFHYAWLQGGQSIFAMLMQGFLVIALILTLFSGVSFFMTNRKAFESREFAKFCSACGVGLLPNMPGTWGSLLAVTLIPFLRFHTVLYGVVFFFFIGLGFWSVGRLAIQKHEDPHYVVLDEVCGMLLPFLFIPPHGINLIAGFFLFRLFDILKPFPLRRLEKLPGFWGILMDDLGAGVYTGLLLWVLRGVL